MTCKPFYGTKSNGVVTVFDVEVGKVIYLGWDYYNAGRAVSIPDGWKGGASAHHLC